MRTRRRVSIKQCPQCGWDAEGQTLEAPREATQKRVPPPQKHAFECGNCGYEWIE